MHAFKIVPVERPEDAISIWAEDGACVLDVASELNSQVDVLRDDIYLFSAVSLGGRTAFWAIFRRGYDAEVAQRS